MTLDEGIRINLLYQKADLLEEILQQLQENKQLKNILDERFI